MATVAVGAELRPEIVAHDQQHVLSRRRAGRRGRTEQQLQQQKGRHCFGCCYNVVAGQTQFLLRDGPAVFFRLGTDSQNWKSQIY